ncbi:MAG TPA: acyltransferase [Dongiaceae bacterium]|nr:acyltransferase [Dongiaceae bacterium]
MDGATQQSILRSELTGARAIVYGALLLIFRILTAPIALFYVATGRRPGLFQSIMQCACLLPTFVGVFTRLALLRWMSAGCGRRVTVHLGTLFSAPQVVIGENVYISAFCNLGWAILGDYVVLGSNVQVTSGKHQHFAARTDIPIALQGGRKEPVRVGRGSWIGNGAIVLADVGEECIVGAGSVVVNPIPAWSIAVGSPARVVGDRRNPVAAEAATGVPAAAPRA